jgi:hypothetical protein
MTKLGRVAWGRLEALLGLQNNQIGSKPARLYNVEATALRRLMIEYKEQEEALKLAHSFFSQSYISRNDYHYSDKLNAARHAVADALGVEVDSEAHITKEHNADPGSGYSVKVASGTTEALQHYYG